MALGERTAQHEPLGSHRLFQTEALDEARHIVAGKFCSHKLNRLTSDRQFAALHNHVRGAGLSLNYLRYGADVEIEPGELEHFYLIQIPIRGYAEIRHGAEVVEADAARATVLNPTRHTRMHWAAGCEKVLVQIDRHVLQEAAERYLQLELTGPLEFRTEMSLGNPALRKWVANIGLCIDAAERGELFTGTSSCSQIVVEESLLQDLLEHQPSNIQHFLKGSARSCPARHVRKAIDFLHGSVGEPVTIGELANAAGVSSRCLQLAFRDQFGCSPLQYLKRLRLDLAHFELQKRKTETSVADVAYGLGFNHLGRFAAEYRAAFGQSPSATLKSGGRTEDS